MMQHIAKNKSAGICPDRSFNAKMNGVISTAAMRYDIRMIRYNISLLGEPYAL